MLRDPWVIKCFLKEHMASRNTPVLASVPAQPRLIFRCLSNGLAHLPISPLTQLIPMCQDLVVHPSQHPDTPWGRLRCYRGSWSPPGVLDPGITLLPPGHQQGHTDPLSQRAQGRGPLADNTCAVRLAKSRNETRATETIQPGALNWQSCGTYRVWTRIKPWGPAQGRDNAI